MSAAHQALTKMALFGMGKQRHSPAGKLATWGVVNLAEQSSTYCHTVQQAGNTGVNYVRPLTTWRVTDATMLASLHSKCISIQDL